MWKCYFLPMKTISALALLIEMGPLKDREKLWPGWELNPRPSNYLHSHVEWPIKTEFVIENLNIYEM